MDRRWGEERKPRGPRPCPPGPGVTGRTFGNEGGEMWSAGRGKVRKCMRDLGQDSPTWPHRHTLALVTVTLGNHHTVPDSLTLWLL